MVAQQDIPKRIDNWSGHRSTKPRQTGLTMVMDKGAGPEQIRDWLDIAAEYVDYVKLGFGTSMLYPPAVLRRKVQLIVESGIGALPGGTLLEAAIVAGDVDGFFKFARFAGFTHVEVSDGTVDLAPRRRRQLIRQAREAGFRVLTEVGKKDPSRPLDPARALEQISLDLEAGAEKVIVEARGSGRGSGVFDESGLLRDDVFEGLLDGLDPGTPRAADVGTEAAAGADHDPGAHPPVASDTATRLGACRPSVADVIWEAPHSAQQLELLLRLGPETSFGNVRPEGVFTLEAMRRGLRSETLRLRMKSSPPVPHQNN